jgi:hypothetical protein
MHYVLSIVLVSKLTKFGETEYMKRTKGSKTIHPLQLSSSSLRCQCNTAHYWASKLSHFSNAYITKADIF